MPVRIGVWPSEPAAVPRDAHDPVVLRPRVVGEDVGGIRPRRHREAEQAALALRHGPAHPPDGDGLPAVGGDALDPSGVALADEGGAVRQEGEAPGGREPGGHGLVDGDARRVRPGRAEGIGLAVTGVAIAPPSAATAMIAAAAAVLARMRPPLVLASDCQYHPVPCRRAIREQRPRDLGGRGRDGRPADQPRQAGVPGGDQARGVRVLPRGRRRHGRAGRRAPHGAGALARRRRRGRRPLLPEAPAEVRSSVRARHRRALPERSPRHPAGSGDSRGDPLGRADGRHHVPRLAGHRAGRRSSRPAAPGPRSVPGERLRRRSTRGGVVPRGAGRARPPVVRQDQRQPWTARLRADRAGAQLRRRPPCGHRDRPRARATRSRRGHGVVVEGGARRPRVPRLQPERTGPADGVGLLAAPATLRACVDAVRVGRPR